MHTQDFSCPATAVNPALAVAKDAGDKIGHDCVEWFQRKSGRLSGGVTPRESMPLFVKTVMEAAPTTHFVVLTQPFTIGAQDSR